jgi:hypothetical protein
LPSLTGRLQPELLPTVNVPRSEHRSVVTTPWGANATRMPGVAIVMPKMRLCRVDRAVVFESDILPYKYLSPRVLERAREASPLVVCGPIEMVEFAL